MERMYQMHTAFDDAKAKLDSYSRYDIDTVINGQNPTGYS